MLAAKRNRPGPGEGCGRGELVRTPGATLGASSRIVGANVARFTPPLPGGKLSTR